MKTSCIDPPDFGTLLTLPEEHPARLHLAGCTRCQARWRTYRAFLDDREDPAGSRVGEADAALMGTIRRQFGLPAQENRARGFLRGGWRWRILVLTPATVAAVVAFLAITRVMERGSRPRDALRGSSVTALRLYSPRALTGGGIRLSWARFPGADTYRLSVFDPRLRPVLLKLDVPDTTLVLDPSELPSTGEAGSTFLWRISALREDEEIGTSEVAPLQVP